MWWAVPWTFFEPEQLLKSTLPAMGQPPSTLLKQFHHKLEGKSPTQAQLLEIAKKCLLPVHEVNVTGTFQYNCGEQEKGGH